MAKGYAEFMAERGATTMADFRLACDYLCVVREDLRYELVTKISNYPGVTMVEFMQASDISPE